MSTSDVNRLGNRYAKALETHTRLERAMRLAFNRWDRSRADLVRLEKRLDRLTMEGAP